MEKKELIIGLAILIIVGATVGSVAMKGNDDKKHIDKKTKIVLETDQNKDSKDNEDSQEQAEESNTEENNTSEEQKEENVETSSSEQKEEKKETKKESKKEEKSKKTEEKKSKKESKKEEKKTFSTEASKPSSKPASSKPTPSKPEPSKPNKPNKPSHTHNWVATTKQVHHPAVGHNEKVLVKAAWTEKIPRYTQVAREICNTCGADITENVREHIKKHMLAGEGGSHRTEYKKVFSHYEEVYHPAQYTTKWVIDKAAWTETVVTGYHCSCGAKK